MAKKLTDSEKLLVALRENLVPYLSAEPENAKKHTVFIVGFSGGRDSLALLWGLNELVCGFWRGRVRLLAAHLNHNLRGAAAAADEAFCREFCRTRGIEYVAALADLTMDMPNLEQQARQARYGWFAELMSEREAAGERAYLLTAHHLEDQAETVLLHLLRGSGTTGLAAMRGQSGRHLRPLLAVPRAVLEGALLEQKLIWQDDETNESTDYTRNFVRHLVLPPMRRVNPQADRALAQAAEIAACEEDYFAELIVGRLAAKMQGNAYPWADLAAEHMAIRRRLVRAMWCRVTAKSVCPLGLKQVDGVLSLKPGGALVLAGAVTVRRRGKMLVWQISTEEELEARRAKSRKGQ